MAALLVFATFYMRTIVPLRVTGTISNCAFITYALIDGLVPILVLHSSLLVLNGFHLVQIRRTIAQMRAAVSSDLSLDALLPLMTKRHCNAGQVLFRKGEHANELIYVLNGTIRVAEIELKLGSGDMLGKISMFSPSKERTATAICETDVELLCMTDERVLQLYYQNPNFGLYLVQLITQRLIQNYSVLEVSFYAKPLLGEAVTGHA